MKENDRIISLIKEIKEKLDLLESDISLTMIECKQIGNLYEFEVNKLRAENESLRERVETQAALIRKKGY